MAAIKNYNGINSLTYFQGKVKAWALQKFALLSDFLGLSKRVDELEGNITAEVQPSGGTFYRYGEPTIDNWCSKYVSNTAGIVVETADEARKFNLRNPATSGICIASGSGQRWNIVAPNGYRIKSYKIVARLRDGQPEGVVFLTPQGGDSYQIIPNSDITINVSVNATSTYFETEDISTEPLDRQVWFKTFEIDFVRVSPFITEAEAEAEFAKKDGSNVGNFTVGGNLLAQGSVRSRNANILDFLTLSRQRFLIGNTSQSPEVLVEDTVNNRTTRIPVASQDCTLATIDDVQEAKDYADELDAITNSRIDGLGTVYNVRGSSAWTVADPTSQLYNSMPGDVWNITEDFTLGGETYPAGTNVVCIATSMSTPDINARFDALAGSIDLSEYFTREEAQTLEGQVVKHTTQSLSDAQQAQARSNIGAAALADTYTKSEVDSAFAKKDGAVALAGSAETLLGDSESVEFGGGGMPTSSDGMALIKEVRGRSIVWNQILANGNFASTTEWVGVTSLSDGAATSYKAGTGSSAYQDIARTVAVPVTVGHKYLFAVIAISNNADTNVRIQVTNTASVGGSPSRYQPTWAWVGYIWEASVASILPRVRGTNNAGTDISFSAREYCIYDLTKMFGAGKEPATVEEFVAMYGTSYHDYNAGEIMSNKTEALTIHRAGGGMEWFHLNLSTLTGKLNGQGDSVTIFPDGMRSAGSVYDALVADSDGYAHTAIMRMGVRAYQSGDESNPAVVTDGESTVYALSTPQTYTLDTLIPLTLRTYKGGTIVKQSSNLAPMSMEAAMPLDMAESYISEDSMDNFLTSLGTAMGGTWTKTYNATTGKWEFSFAHN